eukprot:715732-Pyramimonas_sp.AAC.1
MRRLGMRQDSWTWSQITARRAWSSSLGGSRAGEARGQDRRCEGGLLSKTTFFFQGALGEKLTYHAPS